MTESNTNNEAVSTNAWTVLDRAAQREFPSNDPAVLEIWGYADEISYVAGDEVNLRVHTTAPKFDIVIYRDGYEKKTVYTKENIIGVRQTTPENAYEIGCNWSDVHSFTIPSEWSSGVYLIILQAEGKNNQKIEREAFFVLRSSAPGKNNSIVFVLTMGTYAAYNDWGGANHYRRVENGKPSDKPAPVVSLERPLARGMLRLPKGAPRYADTPEMPVGGMPRYPWLEWAFAYDYCRHYCDSGWAQYELPFVEWAEKEGYKFDFLTQYDLQERPGCLEPYSVAILVGHDEYWSWEMRDAVDSFVENGGNIARFAGNLQWQIRVENNAKTQVCYKLASTDPCFNSDHPHLTSTFLDAKIVGRPASETLGLTGLGGIYSRFGNACPRASGGLTVYRPEHWVFEDTDLYYADQFGGAPVHVNSFEVDSVDYTFRSGLPYPTHKDGAPETLEILAMAPSGGVYESDRRGELVNAPRSEALPWFDEVPLTYELTPGDLDYGAAMVAVFSRGKGTVFNAGCCEWVTGLIKRDFFVEQITRNVLNRLNTQS
jgi:hypothetical protein